MVVHASAAGAAEYATSFNEWRELLAASDAYARLTGWRFVKHDFMHLSPNQSDDLRAAREAAMPMALEYADRIGAIVEAVKGGAEPTRLLSEFQACQRLVAAEAVYNSMRATLTAVGLSEESQGKFTHNNSAAAAAADASDTIAEAAPAPDAVEDEEDTNYQDMSQPIEVIAKRLNAYHRKVEAAPAMAAERRRRTLHASFIVEFGLEYGLPERSDSTSEATLQEFLQRLGEWEGGKQSDLVRDLVLESIPPGQRGLRAAAVNFFQKHPTEAVVGGVIIGGLVGLVVAGTGVALSSLSNRKR